MKFLNDILKYNDFKALSRTAKSFHKYFNLKSFLLLIMSDINLYHSYNNIIKRSKQRISVRVMLYYFINIYKMYVNRQLMSLSN